MHFKAVSPALGMEVSGIDLSSALDDETFKRIERAWHDGLILLFRNQSLDEVQQAAFAARFGELGRVLHKHDGRGTHPGVMYVSNIVENGRLIGALPDGEMYFHSDQCYTEKPAMATMLYAMEIPSRGGNTRFANMYRAYETLPQEVKSRLHGRKAWNVYDYQGNPTKRGEVEGTLRVIRIPSCARIRQPGARRSTSTA